MNKKISFVYPCYNEAENIETTVRLSADVGRSCLDEFEIIVVDDASTDTSVEIAESLRSEIPQLTVCRHAVNSGLGEALRTGFEQARLDWVLYIDSDLPIDLLELTSVLPDLDLAEDELLIGYRLGRAEGPRRALFSLVYNQMIRALFGLRVRDVNFAFKLIPRHLLWRSDLRSRGSFIDAEILLESARQGASFREMGLQYHPRIAGESTIGGLRVVPTILRELADYRRTRWAPPLQGRRLIINADDLGLSEAATSGSIRSIEHGVVRSASIMPTGDDFENAASYAATHCDLDVGVHLALCDGRPISRTSDVATLIGSDGRFPASHRAFLGRYLRGRVSMDEVEQELRAQVQAVVSSGIEVSHIDSHQHIHALPGVARVVEKIARDFGIRAIRRPADYQLFPDGRIGSAWLRRSAESAALRCMLGSAGGGTSAVWHADHFIGMTNAGGMTSELSVETIRKLRRGVTEAAFHPYSSMPPWQRTDEVATLTSPRLQRSLRREGVEITTFREAARAG